MKQKVLTVITEERLENIMGEIARNAHVRSKEHLSDLKNRRESPGC